MLRCNNVAGKQASYYIASLASILKQIRSNIEDKLVSYQRLKFRDISILICQIHISLYDSSSPFILHCLLRQGLTLYVRDYL